MQALEFAATFITGGVLNQGLTWLTSRRKNRIDEAKIISEISAKLRAELFEQYEQRGKTISILRRMIIKLTNLLDEMLPKIKGITHAEFERLRDTTLEARLAGLAAEV